MLAEMRPSELGEWLALWHINPWGEERADLRAGIVASTIANVHRDTKKRTSPFRAAEFMPYRERDVRGESAALSKRLLAAFGLKPKGK